MKAVWTTDSRVVRFAGQDVAAVAAVSPDVARDAARLVKVSYKERPFTHELREAMKPDAPRVFNLDRLPVGPGHGPQGQRRRARARAGPNRGDVEKGFAEAEVVHEGTYYCPVHTHAPLETHGVVASWEGDQLTVYASTQGIFAVREGVAEALGIDRKNVRVLCEHMGGGFGSKLGPSASGSAFAMVACRLAKKAGAPVKLMLDRKQEHLCTGNAPSALMTVKVGAKKDGTLTAVHYQSWGSAGVAGGAGTAGPAGALHGKNPNFKAEEYDVFTNAGPAAPLRAPGHSQGAFGIESAMDELADKLGMDPLELRKKNEASPVRMAQYDLGRQGDRLGAPQQEGRRHVDGRLGRGARRRSKRGHRHGERQLVRVRLRELERPGEGPPRRLGRGDHRLPGHRHRLPHRDDGGGGRGARDRARATSPCASATRSSPRARAPAAA